ncbi:MAG: tRNA (adenosine(37)-N6)-threonylcarbamoyltransferase complex ATPase subunit type 1 TsaE [Candidatus Omnitrophota bacterium]|jgi:tRNA threonylcarbamoyladenosine biosynthesis protein TsaE
MVSRSVKETLKIGSVIAKNSRKGDIICLFGEFGAGKTVLTKGIASGLGIKMGDVISPSFVLIRQHSRGRIPLYHFDLYRLERVNDILALGYEEYFYDDGVTVVEWADRLKSLLPREYLKIRLRIRSDLTRAFEFSAFGRRHKELLRKINEDIRD